MNANGDGIFIVMPFSYSLVMYSDADNYIPTTGAGTTSTIASRLAAAVTSYTGRTTAMSL